MSATSSGGDRSQGDRYVSIDVDGVTQDLRAFLLPRSELGGVWSRGALIEEVLAVLVPTDDFGGRTDDGVFWDNLAIRVSQSPFQD